MARSLSYSVVVATYNREDALRRCLGWAMRQSRPPREVVVVDASRHWAQTRGQILSELAAGHPEIRWDYRPARKPSLTAQRNQALALATSDVLFLIDDDSYMYPDCAEVVMKVYEADPAGAIAGVSPVLADRPPEQAVSSAVALAAPPTGPRGALQNFTGSLRSLFDGENWLFPYDGAYPEHVLPAGLHPPDVVPIRFMHGARMTYRRGPIQQERFDEMLKQWAALEDFDASYRVSRHGSLVHAIRARLFHEENPSARLSRYTRTLLCAVNAAVLYRLKGRDPRLLLRSMRYRLLKRLAVQVGRDMVRRRFSLPYARADWAGLKITRKIENIECAALRDWHAAFQCELIERNPS